jgi:mannose-1-phosphate guanylyltransferase
MTRPKPWPALVLAAGLGTRLAPLSQVRAKAALPVAGRPLIVRILEQLHRAGVRQVVINLHHRAETIAAIVGDGAQLGIEVRYSWESQVLGSGGGPARALPLLAADRFFVVNGDTMADVDFARLADCHERSGAQATLAVAPARLSRYSALLADDADRLVGTTARGTSPADWPASSAAWHFVGVQAVDASAFSSVSPVLPSEVIRGLYLRLVARCAGAIRVFRTPGEFYDIGTPADYLDTVRRVARVEGRALDRGEGSVIDPSARIEDCVLWDRVRVGAHARLTGCIVADDVVIPPGMQYDRMVITRDSVAPF